MTAIEPSLVQRIVAGARYALTGLAPADWFGPQTPLAPQAPETVEGRQFDYPVGFNVRTQPRGEEPVSFAQMRALADAYDVLRLVIETRKDTVCALDWTVKPRDAEAEPDDRCKRLADLLQSPDRMHDWATWLRMVLEDLLVIDAPTLYVRPTRGGAPYGFDPIDGTTVKRVLDPWGRTPMPPEVAYQQILKGVPAVEYSVDELIYRPRNVRTSRVYGYSPVEQIITTVNIALRRQANQLSYYAEGNTPNLIFSVPKEWQPNQIREFQNWWDSLTTGASKHTARFVPEGVQPYDTKPAALKDEYDEWLARIVCYAFGVEPTPFVKQQNRATAQTQREQAIAEGVGPTKLWVKSLVDEMLRRLGAPDLEFGWKDEEAPDPLVRAQIDQIYVAAKVLTPDEVRQSSLGLEALTPEQRDELNPPPPPALAAAMQGEATPDAPEQDDPQGDAPAAKEAADRLGKSVATSPTPRAVVEQGASTLTGLFGAFFDAQAPRVAAAVVAAIEASGKVAKGKASPERAALAEAHAKRVQAILDDLDFTEWDSLVDPAENVLVVIGRDGAREGLARMKLDSDTAALDQAHELSTEWARDRAAELVGKKWVDDQLVDNPNAKWAISESTREFLRSDVTQALEEGWSNDRLAEAIGGNYAFSAERAETIARTETARADATGSLIGYSAGGAVGKRWIVGSETDCEVCQGNADAGPIDLDADFPDGSDVPPAHPRCVCDLIPVLPDDKDSE